jgi:hypothetical protein
LSVTDGKSVVNTTVVFEISRPPSANKWIPGFEVGTLWSAIALTSLALAVSRRIKKRRWSP